MGILGFVSYSNRNRATAERTSEALEALGVSTFLAHRHIIASQDWEKRIRKELHRCSIFVPVVTKAFWESEWAPQELGAAATRSPAEAEERLALLRPFYSKLDKRLSTTLGEFLAKSKNVARSKKCRRELVPAFLRSRRSLLPAALRVALAGVSRPPKGS